ncbi:hypothetical protein MMC30_006342 [Trapelia coarctata]|nr:hypothetical protein [Trapelia coarctata]
MAESPGLVFASTFPPLTAPLGFQLSQTTDSSGQTTLITVSNPPTVTTTSTHILQTTSPSSAIVTVSITAPATSSPAAASTSNGLSFGAMMAAIIVPILVVLALLPIIYLLYLRRRHKREEHEAQERPFPPETKHLVSDSRRNSTSLPSLFVDNNGTRSGSLGIINRPSSEILRVPSPTLPSPSLPVFRAQESWPLSEAPLPDPPSAHGSQTISNYNTTLRPPSSSYGAPSPQLRPPPSPLSETDMSSHDLRHPPSNRQSDAVSEMSFEQEPRGLRPGRDADTLSMVSALSPDDRSERHMHQTF